MRNQNRYLLAGAACLMAAAPAIAGPLTIAPTTVEIAPDRQSGTLTVTNDGDRPADLQFRAYAWSQANGGEVLTPTTDLVVSPAVVTVPPHRKQVFRILRVRTTQPGAEPSYRLRLNELPQPGAGGIAINLEFSIPVFVTPSRATPQLAWSSDGGTVVIANTGNRRVRLGKLSLTSASGAPVAIAGAQSVYLLAGSSRAFPLAAPIRSPAPDARLSGATDFGPVDVTRTPSAPR